MLEDKNKLIILVKFNKFLPNCKGILIKFPNLQKVKSQIPFLDEIFYLYE